MLAISTEEQETNADNIAQLCGGSTEDSLPNINNTIVGCSMLYGAPRRQDSGQSLIPDPLSSWTTPIYSCATALKATIRTVTFTFNGTDIAGLSVISALPKTYTGDEDTPVWGVETITNPQLSYTTMQPLWGVLGTANSYKASAAASSKMDNFSTITQPSLYLPGFMNGNYLGTASDVVTLGNLPQNLPGVNFYAKALQMATSISSPGNSKNAINYKGGADYSGFTSLALFAQWQNLTSSASLAGKVIDLVWTDFSANAVVGTRGWGLRSSQEGSGVVSEVLQVNPTTVPVVVYQRVVRYRIPFATPAFVTMAALLIILLLLLTLVAKGRSNAARMRTALEATSVGRIAAMGSWSHEIAEATKDSNGAGVEGVGGRKMQITEKGGVKAMGDSNEQIQS